MFVHGQATILHADLDAFYASVEQRDDPGLRGRPVIVGEGVVLAASYEAKACGVRTPMGAAQALRLCPRAVTVRPRMSAYSEASRAVFAVFQDTTPLVEGLSIDEAFLEVGGLWRVSGSPTEIAVRLRRDVLERVGLPITVGVARTKFLAKVASGVAKPDGLLVVPPDGELAFLHPLPVHRLWGVGPVTASKLEDRGITTVGQVAMLAEDLLVSMLGQGAGRHLHALAQGLDPRAVQVGRRRRSIGSQQALGRAVRSPHAIDTIVVGLVDRVTRRLRAADRWARTVVLRLRFDDFSPRHPVPHAATRHYPNRFDPGRGQDPAGISQAHHRISWPHPGGYCSRQSRRRLGPAGIALRPRRDNFPRRHAGPGAGPLWRIRHHPSRAPRPGAGPVGPPPARLTPHPETRPTGKQYLPEPLAPAGVARVPALEPSP